MTRSIVCLHGWGMQARIWNDLVSRLSSTHRLLTPALPGHASPLPAEASLAAWGQALLPEIPAGSVLLGWSLGGMLALELAARAAQPFSALVLIGSSPRFVADAAWPHALPADTVTHFKTGFARAPAATQRRFIALQGLGDAHQRALTKQLQDALADTTHADATQALDVGLQLLESSDLREICTDIALPTLLLHGENDALMPAGAAHWLARQIPGARLEILNDCGHVPFLSQPERCARLILDFLDAL